MIFRLKMLPIKPSFHGYGTIRTVGQRMGALIRVIFGEHVPAQGAIDVLERAIELVFMHQAQKRHVRAPAMEVLADRESLQNSILNTGCRNELL